MTVECPSCKHKFYLAPRRKQGHSNVFHKALSYVATELGQDMLALKVTLKLMYGPWIAYPMDELPEWPGKFVATEECYDITGHPAVFLKSESNYTKEEEQQLMNGLLIYANDNHISMEWVEEG